MSVLQDEHARLFARAMLLSAIAHRSRETSGAAATDRDAARSATRGTLGASSIGREREHVLADGTRLRASNVAPRKEAHAHRALRWMRRARAERVRVRLREDGRRDRAREPLDVVSLCVVGTRTSPERAWGDAVSDPVCARCGHTKACHRVAQLTATGLVTECVALGHHQPNFRPACKCPGFMAVVRARALRAVARRK